MFERERSSLEDGGDLYVCQDMRITQAREIAGPDCEWKVLWSVLPHRSNITPASTSRSFANSRPTFPCTPTTSMVSQAPPAPAFAPSQKGKKRGFTRHVEHPSKKSKVYHHFKNERSHLIKTHACDRPPTPPVTTPLVHRTARRISKASRIRPSTHSYVYPSWLGRCIFSLTLSMQ